MQIIFNEDDAVERLVAEKLWGKGTTRHFNAFQTLGVINDEGVLVAGVVYHTMDSSQHKIEISVASWSPGTWITRGVLCAAFAYPFNQLGVKVVYGQHSEKNTAARRFWEHLGAKQTVIDNWWDDGGAGVVAIYTQEQWDSSRWCLNPNKVVAPIAVGVL